MTQIVKKVRLSPSGVATVISTGIYQPSKEAMSKFKGWVDQDGNLYRDTKKDIKKRTATNVNDKKKTYRICIDEEKFSVQIDVAKAKALWSK